MPTVLNFEQREKGSIYLKNKMCAWARELASSRVVEWDGRVRSQHLSSKFFSSLGEHFPYPLSHVEWIEVSHVERIEEDRREDRREYIYMVFLLPYLRIFLKITALLALDTPGDFCSFSQSEKMTISFLIMNIHALNWDSACHYNSQISSEGNWHFV